MDSVQNKELQKICTTYKIFKSKSRSMYVYIYDSISETVQDWSLKHVINIASGIYPYLPNRRIDPLNSRSYPQGGVQIYPHSNLLHKIWTQKYLPPNRDLKKNNHC